LPGDPKRADRKAGTMTALRCASKGASRHAVRNLRTPIAGAACKGDSRLDRITDTGWDGLRRRPGPTQQSFRPGRG
jgi:hypothetical protein